MCPKNIEPTNAENFVSKDTFLVYLKYWKFIHIVTKLRFSRGFNCLPFSYIYPSPSFTCSSPSTLIVHDRSKTNECSVFLWHINAACN